MILLSNKEIQECEKIALNDIKANSSLALFNHNDLNSDSFFYKFLASSCTTQEFIDFEPVDNVFTTAYNVQFLDNEIVVIEKIDMTNYIEDILKNFLSKDLDLYYYTPKYLNELFCLNSELSNMFIDYEKLTLDIFKNSLNESIYSASSIRNILDNCNTFSPNYLEYVGRLIENNLNDCLFFSERLLNDLIYLGRKCKIYTTYKLQERLEYLMSVNENSLPF